MSSNDSAADEVEQRHKKRGSGLPAVGAASLVAAAASYIILFLAARSLTPEENAFFLTFWAILFFVLGVLAGIINEFTRAVRAREATKQSITVGARVLPTGLLIGGCMAAVVASTAPFWAGSVFPVNTVQLVVVLCVAALAYAGHCSLAGASGGSQKWSLFASLAASEAVLRLALVVVVILTTSSRLGLEMACAAGALTWLLIVLLSPGARRGLGARADVGAGVLLRNSGHAMASAAATAALITGFPVLLRFTTPLSEYATAAPLILAISLTRAPIMIPLQSFQSVLISGFVDLRRRALLRKLVRPVAGLLALGVVGAVAAGLLGPLIMLIFGPAYVVSPLTMASLTFAASLMALLTVTGTACLAQNAHFLYSFGWVSATLTTFLVLLLPGTLEARVLASLTAGPLVGALVHVVALMRSTELPTGNFSKRDTP